MIKAGSRDAELIGDIIAAWSRSTLNILECGPRIRVSFTDPLLAGKYGAEAVIQASRIHLVPPMLSLDETFERYIEVYKYLSSFTSSIQCFKVIVVLDDCSEEYNRTLLIHEALLELLKPGIESLRLSIILERLLRYSSELKALDRIDVSEDEYLRYQELREKVSRLIREGLKIAGSEEVMIKALSLAEEALRKTGKAVLNTSLLDSILGLNTGGSMITVRLSSLVEKCSGKYAELYKRMVEKLEAVYGNIYLVLTPEYSILKRLPGMEEKTVVIEWPLSYKSI